MSTDDEDMTSAEADRLWDEDPDEYYRRLRIQSLRKAEREANAPNRIRWKGLQVSENDKERLLREESERKVREVDDAYKTGEYRNTDAHGYRQILEKAEDTLNRIVRKIRDSR